MEGFKVLALLGAVVFVCHFLTGCASQGVPLTSDNECGPGFSAGDCESILEQAENAYNDQGVGN